MTESQEAGFNNPQEDDRRGPVSRIHSQRQSRVSTPTAANIGRARTSATKASVHPTKPVTRPTDGPCHVCGRVGCTLVSHRTFVFPTRSKQQQQQQRLKTVTASSSTSSSASSSSKPSSSKTSGKATGIGIGTWEDLEPIQILEIRNGRLDPFISLPVGESFKDNQLFQHFFMISAGRIVTATGRNATHNLLTTHLLPLAVKYPALCQGAIVYAAAQIANIRGDVVPDKQNLIRYHKSLHLLSQSVKNNPERFKDVFIIAAIATAGFDLTYGRVEELRRHLDSMHKIIQSLGGLPYLGLGGLAAHLVLWMDFFGSIMLNRRPLYHLPSRPNITLPGPPPKYGKSFDGMLEIQALDEKLLSACIQTCRLTELLEKIAHNPGPSGEVEYFTFKRNLTDHHFAVTNAEHFGTRSIASCVCLASITLELWILHNVGQTHAIFHHLGIELQKALMATDLFTFWGENINILQWILFTAGAVMSDRNGGRWYQNMARQSLIHQYQHHWPFNWRELQKQNVTNFIFSETFLVLPFEAFCNRITAVEKAEMAVTI